MSRADDTYWYVCTCNLIEHRSILWCLFTRVFRKVYTLKRERTFRINIRYDLFAQGDTVGPTKLLEPDAIGLLKSQSMRCFCLGKSRSIWVQYKFSLALSHKGYIYKTYEYFIIPDLCTLYKTKLYFMVYSRNCKLMNDGLSKDIKGVVILKDGLSIQIFLVVLVWIQSQFNNRVYT